MGEIGKTVKKGFAIPTWMIAIVALALIIAAAVQFGGNTSPIDTSTETSTDQSAIDAGTSGSSSSGSSGTGNVAGSDENDSAPIKGVRFVTPAITNNGGLEILTNPNSAQIVEGDAGSSVQISIFKNDIGKLSINNVRGKTLKNFRSQQYGDTTVIYANISNPLKNEISFSGDLLIKPIASPEMSVGRARETVTANGEAIVLRFSSEEWNKASVLWLSISI
ncbi:MAG: hypothetical protein WA063_07185 [Minisyncoccia bacterium]